MASFDRAIPPGGEGKITLTVNTKGYEGNIHKTTKVYTNDPKIAIFILGIRASVQVPISVRPRYVRLYGKEDATITKNVTITAVLEKPLLLEAVRFNLEGKVTYKIEEIEKGRKFKVYFTSLPGVTGSYRGVLNLKTNYEEKPMININIGGRIRKKQLKRSE